MTPLIASVVYACGIAGLFYLDRDKTVRTSKALWLPVIYLWILGSRPVSTWLGIAPAPGTDVQLDGSPVDRIIFAILLIAAVVVLIQRGRHTLKFLNANFPIVLYFLFCLASVLWSSYPEVSVKRWAKSIGDLLMVLIVVTDAQPLAALRRLFSRLGFILIPASLLLIKYYPYYGRGYDSYSGAPANFGVTTNKNILGVMTFILLLGALWRIIGLLRSDEMPSHRGRHLLAHGALFFLGVYLLIFANSDTSTVAFVLGAGLLLASSLPFVRRNAGAVHVLVLAILVAVGFAMLFGGTAGIAHALGRNSHLTGRTDIWAAVIPMVPNPLVGAGFESFWLSPVVLTRLWRLFPHLPLNEAHNGYVEVYLELGWVGVGLIALILLDGYRRSVKALRREPMLGGLLIAYVLCAMIYNIAEAGFRMADPMWIFLLLAVVEASGIAAGVEESRLAVPDGRISRFAAAGSFTEVAGAGTAMGKSYQDKRLRFSGTHGRVDSRYSKPRV
jgi:exopolysaccharide production protein ExoQ